MHSATASPMSSVLSVCPVTEQLGLEQHIERFGMALSHESPIEHTSGRTGVAEALGPPHNDARSAAAGCPRHC